MQARLEAMELAQRGGIDMNDVSDAEEEPQEQAAEPEEEGFETRFIKAIVGASSKPKLEVPMYEGSLDVEKLIDWISGMEKYFEYENVVDDKSVKFAVTRLQGHASLWWDGVQDERRQKGKSKIKS